MTIAPSAAQFHASAAKHEDGPDLLLPGELRLTPEQFALVCEANPDAVLELAADGQLIRMTPTGGETGRRNTKLIYQLTHWARSQGGWEVFDSSSGFRLPDGSVLSPDASVVRLDRLQALSAEQRRGFPPLCPDLVVELASASDGGPRGAEPLRRKLASYQANGAQLGWLLFPEQQAVEVWRPGAEPQRLENADVLEGETVLPGLRLELAELWAE
jgi:Uma2 family endonuclease